MVVARENAAVVPNLGMIIDVDGLTGLADQSGTLVDVDIVPT
jgi:hypothetical protein